MSSTTTATQKINSSTVHIGDHLKTTCNSVNATFTGQNRLPVPASQAEDHVRILDPRPPAVRQQSHAFALSDTPEPTAPNSPDILPNNLNPSDKSKRPLPTTLDIPGLTRSRVSPDGRISQRDVGSKLVIVMVGLPARGKSYVTKKVARYLNWLQHDTRIFNVGERRRVAAGGPVMHSPNTNNRCIPNDILRKQSISGGVMTGINEHSAHLGPLQLTAQILVNGESSVEASNSEHHRKQSIDGGGQIGPSKEQQFPQAQSRELGEDYAPQQLPGTQAMDQSANFFDPDNREAVLIREQCALDALDDLLDYILDEGGSVGILDATNSTLERRKLVMKHIRERAGPDLNVLFMESVCQDEELLERNMRLKLSGPDYKDKDPEASLADFKKRVAIYEKTYVPLGDYEERNNMPYVQMIDVGRKVISHQIKGFLSAQAVYYLLNFNLAPRQIWITRHGQSLDNVSGKLGGDSDLSQSGHRYAQALAKFTAYQRKAWEIHHCEKVKNAQLSPLPGTTTPPNPHYVTDNEGTPNTEKNFCVWTSMLQRSIQTAECFDEDDFDVKQMRPLNELNAGLYEGSTYDEIKTAHDAEYEQRREDKLHYRYPGPGGEGYLDVINRLRPVIIELERMTDHVLLIGHRSVVRVLLAYFMGLPRADVADLNVPLGMLYCLEPKPYGVDFKAYHYNAATEWFELDPGYKLHKATSPLD